MGIKEKQNEMVELLAKNEEKLSVLYETYAEKFPEYKEFWFDLAKEEVGHAAWIRKLNNNSALSFNEDRFKSKHVEISLKYLDEKIREAQTQKIDLADVLSVAIELETNLIERDFFSVFDGDPDELKETFQNLKTATQAHAERVRALWLKKKKRS